MKILFITTSYEQKANSAAIRNNAWVAGLIANGVIVDVLTIEWPQFMQSEFLISHNQARVIHTSLPELKALHYTRTPNKPNRSKLWQIMAQFKNYIRDIVYFPDICKNWPNKINSVLSSNYDIIISSSDFKSSHYAALKIIKEKHKKWIQVWGDPWSTDINLSTYHKNRVRKCEYNLLKKADKIIYVSEFTRHQICNQYPDLQDKIAYIPRGFYLSPSLDETSYQHDDKRVIELVYTGVLSKGRNIDLLIRAINQYNSRAPKPIVLSLYGNYQPEQIEILNQYDWIHINESVDYGKIMKIYATADALLFISNGVQSTQIPGKLFDYMGTARPIISLTSPNEKDLNALLHKYDNCLIIDNSTVETITVGLTSLPRIVEQRYRIIEEYSPKEIGRQLLEHIKKC